MKRVSIRFLQAYNAIIAGIMAILGFAFSCESVDEYGTPSATFKVNGEVISSETNQPVKNIRVIMKGDTTHTDDEGFYQVADEFGFPEDQTYTVIYQDIDGASNGHYEDLDTVVEFKNAVYTNGDGHWYKGETSKDLNVKLHPKE